MRRGDPTHDRTFRAVVCRGGRCSPAAARRRRAFSCPAGGQAHGAAPIGFRPVPVAEGGGPNPTISPDYRYSVLIPWGEPLVPGGPAFRHPPNAADQARQIGIGHDGMAFFPVDGSRRGLLVVNHEFGMTAHVLGKPTFESLDDVRAAQHAVGVSVVEIEEATFGRWRTVDSRFARRVHAGTPVAFAGPAAAGPWLATPAGNPAAGTFNDCASGVTPWRTYLACEENFNLYFGAAGGRVRTGRETGALRLARRPLVLRLGGLRPALRPRRRGIRQRSQPLRLGGGGRPVRPRPHVGETDRARPLQARGARRSSSAAADASSSTWATTRSLSTSTSSSPPTTGATCWGAAKARWTAARFTPRGSTRTGAANGAR